GIVSVKLAPQYWLWRPLKDSSDARRRLEGLLEIYAAVLAGEPNTQLVDLRPVLSDVERMLPQAPHVHRPALLSLHILFNLLVASELRTPGFSEFLEKHIAEASKPGIETVIIATLLDATAAWTIEHHRAALDAYLADRVRPKGLHV